MHIRFRAYALPFVILSAAAATVSAASAPQPNHLQLCENGVVAGFPCANVDLAERLSNASLGGGNGNDLWGWTDAASGREFALMGLTNGTAFVEISDPSAPIYLGNLPTHSGTSIWRDIKTLGNFAFVVSEAVDHGMQVFDLTRLLNVSNPPITFTENAHYNRFGRSHNIVIDEESQFAYSVGSRQGIETCNSGLHMIDISSPLTPSFAGCFSADGYTHDAQCTVYIGPDTEHLGKQICLAANEDTVTIVDVSDKSNPIQLSRTTYAGVGYTHQGWLTEDHRYWLVNDETDEINFGHNTRTYIFDLTDLDAPVPHMTYVSNNPASDHNLYVKGQYAYQANYRSGLRILDLGGIGARNVTEAAFFDTTPASNNSGTSGAWSVYPFFDSGTVIVSDVSAGLFVLKPLLCPSIDTPQALVAQAAGDNQIDLTWQMPAPGETTDILRSLDGCTGAQTELATGISGGTFSDLSASAGVINGYRIRTRGVDPGCASATSACVTAQTTGICTAPPAFQGISSAASNGGSQCSISLGWEAAAPRCSGPAQYRVERSEGVTFDPQTAILVADQLQPIVFDDRNVASGQRYVYRVRSIDGGNGAVDDNEISLSAVPVGEISDGDFFSGAELGDPLLGSGTARHVAWETISGVANSGERSYYSGYDNNQCLSLESAPLTITSGQSSTLSFATRYGLEAGWDGGVAQISTNGGASWQTLTPIGGYPSSFNGSSNDACGLPNNSPTFTGTNLNWSPYSVDLSAYSGEIRLRFLFSTDGAVTADGWWVDDVRVTHVQVPGVCEMGAIDVFSDGFEP